MKWLQNVFEIANTSWWLLPFVKCLEIWTFSLKKTSNIVVPQLLHLFDQDTLFSFIHLFMQTLIYMQSLIYMYNISSRLFVERFIQVFAVIDSGVTAQKMKSCIKDFFSKCNQIGRKLRKTLMENFIFCAVSRHFLTNWSTFVSFGAECRCCFVICSFIYFLLTFWLSLLILTIDTDVRRLLEIE